MAKRVRSKRVTSAGEMGQLMFNENCVSQRNVSVGGVYNILGAAGTAVEVGEYASLLIANSANAIAWIAIGNSAVGVPTGFSDGYFLPPYGVMYLSTGELGTHVRASAGTVGVYKLQEDHVVTNNPDEA